MTNTHDILTSTTGASSPSRRPRAVAAVRVAVAIWLVALAGFFWARGYHWGALLLAPAALHLWLAWRRLVAIQNQQ